jgi:chromosome segregation ATPase
LPHHYLTILSELDDKIDQLRHANAERDNLKDDIDVERRKLADAQRQITTLQEQIHRHDIAASELRSETLRLKETITETERSRDDARSSHGPLEREIVALKEKLAAALAHHEHVNNERDAARQQLEQYQTEYEETMETFDQMGNVSYLYYLPHLTILPSLSQTQ